MSSSQSVKLSQATVTLFGSVANHVVSRTASCCRSRAGSALPNCGSTAAWTNARRDHGRQYEDVQIFHIFSPEFRLKSIFLSRNRNISANPLKVTHSCHIVPYSWWTVFAPQMKLAVMKKPTQPPSAREVFGKNLRRARRLKDVSQEELALRADLSRTYVSEVERGVRNVSIDNMGLLAQALGVPLKDLVDPALFRALDDLSE